MLFHHSGKISEIRALSVLPRCQCASLAGLSMAFCPVGEVTTEGNKSFNHFWSMRGLWSYLEGETACPCSLGPPHLLIRLLFPTLYQRALRFWLTSFHWVEFPFCFFALLGCPLLFPQFLRPVFVLFGIESVFFFLFWLLCNQLTQRLFSVCYLEDVYIVLWMSETLLNQRNNNDVLRH